jgi:hypothetical protein
VLGLGNKNNNETDTRVARRPNFLVFAYGVGFGAALAWAAFAVSDRFGGLSADQRVTSGAALVGILVALVVPVTIALVEWIQRLRSAARLGRLRNACGAALLIGDAFYSERLGTEEEYSDWKRNVDAWVEATARELLRLSGPADEAQFRVQPTVMAADIPSSISRRHNVQRLKLSARNATLLTIMNRA